MFTASPTTVSSKRSGLPMAARAAMPVLMPMPARSGAWPAATRWRLRSAMAVNSWPAQCNAASGPPGKTAMTASPIYLSTKPPWAAISGSRQPNHWLSTRTMPSNSIASASVVKRRRSTNMTVTTASTLSPAATSSQSALPSRANAAAGTKRAQRPPAFRPLTR